jgi:hypothetical protein
MQLEKFKIEYQEHETEFYRLLDDFLLNYESIVSDMAFKQGDMFNREDYPSVDQVRSKFGIRLYVAEVPSHDWRCNISTDIASDLKQQYTKQAEEIINHVVSEQVDRLTDVMESISYCCGVQEIADANTGEVKTKKRKIYDTTIEKAKELCATFKAFRPISNDTTNRLSDAVSKLEYALHGVDIDTIRDSDAVREKVKNNVDDILSKFKL